MNNPTINRTKRLLEQAQVFAAADPSDPFTFARCKTHISAGLSNEPAKDGNPAEYEAIASQEIRTFKSTDGTFKEYSVTVYKNLRRP